MEDQSSLSIKARARSPELTWDLEHMWSTCKSDPRATSSLTDTSVFEKQQEVPNPLFLKRRDKCLWFGIIPSIDHWDYCIQKPRALKLQIRV
jgi:hypothetical protein